MSTTTATVSTAVARVSYREKLFVVAICLTYLLIAIHSALLRPLWFDELSTLFVTSTPSLRAMFHAMPTDGNPPLYFLLARPFLHLPIKTELAFRIPSLLAYPITGCTVFWFVRRNCAPVFAFLSMSVYLGSLMVVKYAVEARAYGVLMMIVGLTLCCWQSYARTGDRWALGGISLGICGAILSHQYGIVIVGLPLLAGEAVRSVRLRRIDVRLLCAGAIGASTILLTFPPMLRGQRLLLDAIRACPVFSGHPLLRDLKFYGWMLPALIPLLMVLAVLLSVPVLALFKSRLEADSLDDDGPPEDLAVAFALALLLPVMLMVTHFGTRYFQSRYGIGSAMGVAILAGMLLGRLQAHWRHAASLALAGTVYSLIVGLFTISIANVTMWNIFPWTDPVLHAADFSNDPIVVASALEFSPLWWYSDEHQRGRLHFLSDLPFAAQQSAGLPEFSLALEREITPMQLEDYQAFLQDHHHFFLYCYGEPNFEYIVPRLEREGWHLRSLRSAIQPVRDNKQEYRQLFEVSR